MIKSSAYGPHRADRAPRTRGIAMGAPASTLDHPRLPRSDGARRRKYAPPPAEEEGGNGTPLYEHVPEQRMRSRTLQTPVSKTSTAGPNPDHFGPLGTASGRGLDGVFYYFLATDRSQLKADQHFPQSPVRARFFFLDVFQKNETNPTPPPSPLWRNSFPAPPIHAREITKRTQSEKDH
jgi:hypothetical protein